MGLDFMPLANEGPHQTWERLRNHALDEERPLDAALIQQSQQVFAIANHPFCYGRIEIYARLVPILYVHGEGAHRSRSLWLTGRTWFDRDARIVHDAF